MLSRELTDTIASDEEFGFLLVRQKDMIFELITYRRFQAARHALNVIEELWILCGYGYKLVEFRDIIRRKDTTLLNEIND